MKIQFAVILMVGTIFATGCSSIQDEGNIEDPSSASSDAIDPGLDTTAAQANTDAIPTESNPELDLAKANEGTPAEPAVDPIASASPEEVAPPAPEVAAEVPTEQPLNPEAAPLMATEAPVVDAAPVVAEAAPVVEEPAIDTAAAQEPVQAPVAATEPATESATGGEAKKYSVKSGDTLMKIAFENYGDLYRWKEIFEANREKIQDPNAVPPGTELTLNGAGMVTIERNGEQYMIKGGDTLGSISQTVYGTNQKWKALWENNRQMIKNPNKIYAGFYLYYQPAARVAENDLGLPAESSFN